MLLLQELFGFTVKFVFLPKSIAFSPADLGNPSNTTLQTREKLILITKIFLIHRS